MVSPIDNLLQYVRIKATFIAAQMSESDAEHIIGEVRSFLKEYPFEATVSAQSGVPSRMSEAIWRTLCKVQPIIASDIDKYIDSPPPINDRRWRPGVGTEVMEGEHVCIPLDGSGGTGLPSGSICGGGNWANIQCGRDVLGLRRQSMSAETMQWLMLLNEKKWSLVH